MLMHCNICNTRASVVRQITLSYLLIDSAHQENVIVVGKFGHWGMMTPQLIVCGWLL